ncbi:MAG TPA: helix-turn-helix domain-containing protein [Solirubrobacteraceae bacterium]|nr:helix-turn-helix domain-containing protein [Solirubrobacteraceae bacterium]
MPVRPDDPLAQPTRARLFALLRELRRPVSTEELAERMGLHRNGVRVHLDRLRDQGMVARERERRPRGRPRDMWLVSPSAAPAAREPTAYAQLGRWLARALAADRTSLRRVEATGRQIGHELAPEPQDAPEASFHAALAALGFQPRRESRAPQRLTYRLCNCPYREAARENPEAVCGLHRGITRGLLDTLGATSRLTAFVPDEPTRAGCLIEISGPIAAEGLEQLAASR